MTPRVSLCMPHLDSAPFTRERIESIAAQTFPDWELVIVDSASSDGSLEILQEWAAVEPRVRILPAPREGIYPALNRAIAASKGEFVAIAMGDDTMAPAFLERMVAALDANPGCSLAHCALEIIDAAGAPVDARADWETIGAQRYLGDWSRRQHVRRAPHDGVLHLCFFTVYTSLTQLLFRRSLSERVGHFRTDRGSFADFEWGLRVGMIGDVVFLPERLASWRRHDRQATGAGRLRRARARGLFSRMAADGLSELRGARPDWHGRIVDAELLEFYRADELEACLGWFDLARFGLRRPLYAASRALRRAGSGAVLRGPSIEAFLERTRGMGLETLRTSPLDLVAFDGSGVAKESSHGC